MTTLSATDPARDAERLQALPRLPRDEGGPVFAEAWEAQSFALAVKLSEQGHFTWKEWAAALADELKAAAGRGEPDGPPPSPTTGTEVGGWRAVRRRQLGYATIV